jgi:uridine kinase
VLAIDGPSGSGKTTLARALRRSPARPAGGATVVHLDQLYPGWDGLEAGVRQLVAEVFQPLARGLSAGYRRYDWDAGRYAERHPVPEVPVTIVEGVGSGARACAPYLSLLVWLDAPEEVRYERAMARDGDEYRPHWERWARQERAHVAAERTPERADLRLTLR